MNINNVSQANGKDSVSLLGFTDDQLNAYNGLIEFINSPYDENHYKEALVGPAGTGKTYLVKALIKNCNLSYGVIGLSAPTHKACRVLNESIGISNVKVSTLQSDLGLRLNFNVDNFDIKSPPFDPKGKIKIGAYKLYIVDESSMINRGLVLFLEQLCKEKQCKLIYIGDSSQLAPVNEKYSSAFKGVKTYKLTQIVRQGDDNPISYLLELLRYDIEHKTFMFLDHISKHQSNFNDTNTKGYQVCNIQYFTEIVNNTFSNESITKNVDYCKVIAYTNTCVSNWNKFIRNTIIKDSNKAIINKHDLIISYTTIVNEFNEPIIKNSEEYIVKDIVNYKHPKYNISGFLVRFTSIHGGVDTQPLFIVNHQDIGSIQTYIALSNQFIESAKTANKTLKSSLWRDYFEFKEQCLLLTNIINKEGKLLFGRDLDYGFALTSHKSQGSTFDTTLVDVNDIVFDKYGHPYTDAAEINRRLYVACSRCKNKLYLKYGR